MNHHRAALDAAKEFLEFVRASEKPTLRGLAMRLDTLATLMWPLRDWVYDPDEIPKRDAVKGLHSWVDIISERFSDLQKETFFEPRNASSVIDLGEICLDLEKALVVEALSDEEQAAEHLCWLYWHHFGLHVRDVQLHLYMLMEEHGLHWDENAYPA